MKELRDLYRNITEKKFDFVPKMLENPDNTEFLYQLLWNSGADPCDSYIKYCSYQKFDCSKLFHLMPTSQGPCCTLNMDKNYYKKSPFQEAVLKLRTNGSSEEILQQFVNAPGEQNGLTLILDSKSFDAESGSISDDGLGYLIGVYPQVSLLM